MAESEIYDFYLDLASRLKPFSELSSEDIFDENDEERTLQRRNMLVTALIHLKPLEEKFSEYISRVLFCPVEEFIEPSFKIDKDFEELLVIILEEIGRLDAQKYIANAAAFQILNQRLNLGFIENPFDYLIEALRIGVADLYHENGFVYFRDGNVYLRQSSVA